MKKYFIYLNNNNPLSFKKYKNGKLIETIDVEKIKEKDLYAVEEHELEAEVIERLMKVFFEEEDNVTIEVSTRLRTIDYIRK